MAYDETLAARLRAGLAGTPDLAERRMFGGLCFMAGAHMVCGIYRDRAMFRVGKPNMAAALELPGVRRMEMSGRPMTGFVEVEAAALPDALRDRLMALAIRFVGTLPPK